MNKKVVYLVEGVVLLAIIFFVFYLYYNGIYNLYIDVGVVLVGFFLSARSLYYLKIEKYFWQHLLLANLFFVISFVHLLRFLAG